MPRLFRTRFRDYQLLDNFEAHHHPPTQDFFGINAARSFLQSFDDDSLADSSLRDLVAERFFHSDINRWSDHQVREFVSQKLASGQLSIAEWPPEKVVEQSAPMSGTAAEVVEPPPVRQVVPEPVSRLELIVEIEEPSVLDIEVEIEEPDVSGVSEFEDDPDSEDAADFRVLIFEGQE